MDPESYKIVSDLFSRCVEMLHADREKLLSDVESRQPDIVRHVRELLNSYQTNQAFLEGSALDRITRFDGEDPFKPSANQGREASNLPSKLCIYFSAVSRRLRSASAYFWLFVVLDFVAVGVYGYATSVINRYGTLTVDQGWNATAEGAGWRITYVRASGAAAGRLSVGDRVLAVNGDTRIAGLGLIRATGSVYPGNRYFLRVQREGVVSEIALTNAIVQARRGMAEIVSYLAVSVSFLLTAVLIGLLQPDQRIARRGYAALMTQALVLVKVVLIPYEEFLRGQGYLVYQALSAIDGPHLALAYHFYCTFFDQVFEARRWRYALYIVYPWACLITVLRLAVLTRSHLTFLDTHPLFLKILDSPMEEIFYVAMPTAICIVIAQNYRKVRQPQDRRRARWIAMGSLAGILPYASVRLTTWILTQTGYRVDYNDVYHMALWTAILAAMMIPAATGYAILKHRLFDIHVVVRRGAQYLLAKSVLQAVLAIPAVGLVLALVNNRDRTIADAVWNNASFVVLLALLAAVLVFRMPLTQWLDRQFFRESHRQEQLLVSLIDSVHKLSSVSEMAQQVGKEVATVFHPDSICILFREGSDRLFTSAYQAGQCTETICLRGSSHLLSLFDGSEEARRLSFILNAAPADHDARRLQAMGVDLIVPLAGTVGDVVGFLLLGKKLSEEPYTPADCRLLTGVAGQMAIVYENTALQRLLEEQRQAAHEIRLRFEGGRVDAFRECPECGRCFDVKIANCPYDDSALTFSLPVKRIIDGRYRLDRLIGEGGMGAVYQASDLRLNRPVAIKIIVGSKISTPTLLRRVYREARAVARLNHPHIISTYDFGVIEGDVAYLVMELVPGQTMRAIISAGRIEPLVSAEWFDQLLDGVEAAHRAHIIHRDLKPENVLISRPPGGKPVVKLLDFGIAKTMSTETLESGTLTTPGTLMGSLQYMSPEQLNGEDVDERTDIFSVGVMIFEVLTGRLPFSGKTYTERLISLLHDEVSIPCSSSDKERLNMALKKCLAKDPGYRYASAVELRREIVPLMARYSQA